MEKQQTSPALTFEEYRSLVLADYRTAVTSRESSLLGRREVLTGKAKFGIFGDGKEVAQVAWAKAFQNGDFRSGYYRDMTFMMAIGELTVEAFFASLYADTNPANEPASAGRQMNGHFATHSLNPDGSWRNLTAQKNSSADISPTAGQMPRLVGLAQASKLYRNLDALQSWTHFSNQGNEVAWGTIGNASTSEGLFFEAINAAGVLQIPMVMCVWDDEYGISVHARHQTTKESISAILAGFQRDERPGFEIITARGWNYPELVAAFERAGQVARTEHVPVLLHVVEMTQPQGHSTSGSHERYKSPDRLAWEAEYDCLAKMRQWMLETAVATAEELDALEATVKKEVRDAKTHAWQAYTAPIQAEWAEAQRLLEAMVQAGHSTVQPLTESMKGVKDPFRKDAISLVRQALRVSVGQSSEARTQVVQWLQNQQSLNQDRYNSFLWNDSGKRAIHIQAVEPTYPDQPELVDGRLVLRENFDYLLSHRPETLIFGEDSGKIGDVNQGLEGLQAKHGELRVADTGIREATILGQGIGLAMRGLRPIAEIQYLDYLLYALQIMSDDLATVSYRTKGRQMAPVIVRTRGHRLEGIWHSGSPMGAILNSLRGINILVPRNMTKAAGFYNTMLEAQEPALIIECLNGYRLKEAMPLNVGAFKTPVGIPEVIRGGKDITIVTYGSTCRQAMEAADALSQAGIEAEVIDVQSLLPFDIHHSIVESLQKTNRVLFLDEDVEGGATGFMMQQVLDVQGGYRWLDQAPATLSAKDHRPAYGTDGDYFSKPSADDIFEKVYAMMAEDQPHRFPPLWP
jgi:pyruvate/2-oxoglutarate/acetoin dehydrogenase E1 component/TPP-dependent pyruvate/acetoin dehydrogenase alpha subunit